MKHFIFLNFLLLICIGVRGQNTTTDYIYCSDGFELKKVTGYRVNDFGDSIKSVSTGLYSKDGKILVAAIRDYWSTSYFYVLDGCETICSGAFQAFQGLTVFIPSSITNIAPDALKSSYVFTTTQPQSGVIMKPNIFGGIVDGMKEDSTQGSTEEIPGLIIPSEVARYNLQGVRLTQQEKGVNIVQMSDGTATKQLIR